MGRVRLREQPAGQGGLTQAVHCCSSAGPCSALSVPPAGRDERHDHQSHTSRPPAPAGTRLLSRERRTGRARAGPRPRLCAQPAAGGRPSGWPLPAGLWAAGGRRSGGVQPRLRGAAVVREGQLVHPSTCRALLSNPFPSSEGPVRATAAQSPILSRPLRPAQRCGRPGSRPAGGELGAHAACLCRGGGPGRLLGPPAAAAGRRRLRQPLCGGGLGGGGC